LTPKGHPKPPVFSLDFSHVGNGQWECENSVSALQQSHGLDLNQVTTDPSFSFMQKIENTAQRTLQVAACHVFLRHEPMVNNRGLLRGVVGSFWALRLGSNDG